MKKVIILLVAIAGMSTGSVYAQHNGHDQITYATPTNRQIHNLRFKSTTEAKGTYTTCDSEKVKTKGTHATLTVQGLCGMCKTRIEKAAKSVKGVTAAQWNSETTTLNVSYDDKKTSQDAIGKAIAKAGHDTDKYKAEDKVYNVLPECCKYRK